MTFPHYEPNDARLIVVLKGDTTPVAKQKKKKRANKPTGGITREYLGGMEHLTWFKLTDPQEMEYYSMAVAEDPTKMEKPLPNEIERR